jgi:hypothetical protein
MNQFGCDKIHMKLIVHDLTLLLYLPSLSIPSPQHIQSWTWLDHALYSGGGADTIGATAGNVLLDCALA